MARPMHSQPQARSKVVMAAQQGKATPGDHRETPAVEALEQQLHDVSRPGVGSNKPTYNLRSADEKPSWFQAMTSAGQAPELINGRLAMLGFVAAVGAEIASHENILQQFRSRPVPILLTVAAFSLATLIPIVRGTDYKPFGFFTPGAEIWNGRVAALGLALMILIEACYGTAIFG